MKKTVLFVGPVTTRSGYGARSRDICRSIIEVGYDLTIIPTRWGTTPMNVTDPDLIPYIAREPVRTQPDIFIQCTIPSEFQRAGKVNIGITAGIETDNCPLEWIEGCNRMDLVLTSSGHSKEVFTSVKYEKRKDGKVLETISCKKPVEVLFEGVDTDIFNIVSDVETRGESVVKQLNDIPEEFAYLFVGHWLQGDVGHDRKNIGKLIETFLVTFADEPNPPALVLKTNTAGFSIIERNRVMNKVSEIISKMQKANRDSVLPNVYVLHGDLEDDEMNLLYNHPKIKAMVSFTRGEGFGRPLLEFTTSGKPVIAPNWSGQLDFLHPTYSVLLPGTLESVHHSATNKWIIAESKWYTVNYTIAGQRMKDCFKYYDKYLKRANKQREHTLDNFKLSDMTRKIETYFSQLEFKLDLSHMINRRNTAPQELELNMPKIEDTNG